MAERDLLKRERMDFTGIFDFSAFYSFAHDWFKEERYGVDEEKYSETVSGNERRLLIEWKTTKKLSDYFKMEHRIRFEIEHLVDVEVEIDGKKKKMTKLKSSLKIAILRISLQQQRSCQMLI